MEEASASAAQRLGDLDPHEPEIEEAANEDRVQSGLLVHLADMGPDPLLGERPHAVTENALVFGQDGEGKGGV